MKPPSIEVALQMACAVHARKSLLAELLEREQKLRDVYPEYNVGPFREWLERCIEAEKYVQWLLSQALERD